MKSGYWYTILFVFVISALFTALLASVYAFYLPVIKANEVIADKRSVLYALDLPSRGTNAEVEEIYIERVVQQKIGNQPVYAKYETNGTISAYAFPFVGSGLWGTIRGYLAFSDDFQSYVGVDFTSHSETPGLGGRIDDNWYKDQYRSLGVKNDAQILYIKDGYGDIDAISGATVTSKAVLDMINDTTQKVLKEVRE
jgi:Na+-transporting NADH:ubiquinone oxidoreductase subunit C